MNLHTIQQLIWHYTLGYCHASGCSKLVTNGRMASMFQDLADFKPAKQEAIRNVDLDHYHHPFLAGTLQDIEIWVDPQQRWVDTTIKMEPRNIKLDVLATLQTSLKLKLDEVF